MKTAIYVRSATKDNESLVNQERVVRQYLGDDEVYQVYADSCHSGINPDRPGLRQLLADAVYDRFQSVSVYDETRLSRSLETNVLLQQRLKKLGIVIKSKGVDLSS